MVVVRLVPVENDRKADTLKRRHLLVLFLAITFFRHPNLNKLVCGGGEGHYRESNSAPKNMGTCLSFRPC